MDMTSTADVGTGSCVPAVTINQFQNIAVPLEQVIDALK